MSVELEQINKFLNYIGIILIVEVDTIKPTKLHLITKSTYLEKTKNSKSVEFNFKELG